MTDVRPNLLVILPDQMRGQALGCLNEEPTRTPNLDRLAGESLVLPRTISNLPICSPYRAMLMTGQYPHTNGVTTNCTSQWSAEEVELRASPATQEIRCQTSEVRNFFGDSFSSRGRSMSMLDGGALLAMKLTSCRILARSSLHATLAMFDNLSPVTVGMCLCLTDSMFRIHTSGAIE